MKKIKVMFAYIEAGFGHIMPMKSIESEFTKKYGDKVEIVSSRFYKETGDKHLKDYEKMMTDQVRMYNAMPLFGHFSTFMLNLFGTKISTFASMRLIAPVACKKGIEHMEEVNPDVVFSTHWASNYYAEKSKYKPLTVMYCPDARLNKLFMYPCDLTMLSMPYGYEIALRNKRYDIHNLKLVPFLIRKEAFDITADKKEIRRKLGFNENSFTVLLAEGGYGIGKMEEITRILSKADVPLTVIPVCGTNAKLYKRLKKIESTDKVKVIPYAFADNMLELHAASDIFCGKSGNILAEPTCFGNPSIVTHFANSIEHDIADHYINTVGCAVKEFNAKKTAKMICDFARDPGKMTPYQQAAQAYHSHFGPEKAADILWETIKTKFPDIN